jgi:hypothetical protein
MSKKRASIKIPQRGYSQRLASAIKEQNGPACFVQSPKLLQSHFLVERVDGRPLTILRTDFDAADMGLAWRRWPGLFLVSGKVTTHDDEKLVIAAEV